VSKELRVSASGFSVSGRREHNEDALLILDETHEVVRRRGEGCLFAVADGMGGHAGGQVASRLAVDTLVEFFDTVRGREERETFDRLEEIFRTANERILGRAERDSSLSGMGTTLTAAHARGDVLRFVHVGDSRLYRLRGRRLDLLTEDHNVAHRLLAEGILDVEEYRASPYRSSLLNHLGRESVTVDKGATGLRPGDCFLLATDGLVAAVDERDLVDLLASADPPGAVCDAMRDRIGRSRPGDDATAVCFRFESVLEPHA
jgi:protein phosphatase